MYTTLTTKTGTWRTTGERFATIKLAGAAAQELAQELETTVKIDRMDDGGFRLLWPAPRNTDAPVAKPIRQNGNDDETSWEARNLVGRSVKRYEADEAQPSFSTFDRYLDTPELQTQRDTEQARMVDRQIADLDRQADADAAYYGRSYKARLTLEFTDRSKAITFAKRVKGSLKTVRTKEYVVDSETGTKSVAWELITYVVTYLGNKLVARDGDAEYEAKPFEPGLLHGQRDDAEEHGECRCNRCCPVAAVDTYMAEQLRG